MFDFKIFLNADNIIDKFDRVGLIADYLANYISVGLADQDKSMNVISVVTNELLEIVLEYIKSNSQVVLHLHSVDDDRLSIKLSFVFRDENLKSELFRVVEHSNDVSVGSFLKQEFNFDDIDVFRFNVLRQSYGSEIILSDSNESLDLEVIVDGIMFLEKVF